MLYHKLLVALFAVPFVVAQEAQGAPSDAAAPADGAAPAETPAADGAAPPAETPEAETPAADPAAGGDSAAAPPAATSTRAGSVGGNTENTGHGYQNTTAGDWTAAEFQVPNTEVYWVNEAENTAIWTPYEQAVDLVIFNSNSSLLSEQRQVASNIAAGTGTWTGMISGFTPGNNYILVLALTNDPSRKIGQTRGFWIKRNGTLPAPIPENAAGHTLSGGGVAASGTETPTAAATSSAAAGASGAAESGQAAGGATGAAGKVAASFAAAIGAGALALTLF